MAPTLPVSSEAEAPVVLGARSDESVVWLRYWRTEPDPCVDGL